MNSSKKFIVVYGFTVGYGIITVALFIFLIDPFFHYHMPWFGLQPVVNNEIYQNPGLAEHTSYDSIIIGSSMTENFNTEWFDEACDIHTLKLSYAGASAENLRIAVDYAQNAKESELKYVFGCLDMSILTSDADTPRHPLPDYLYDDRFYNDVYYLLNKDVLFQDVRRVLEENNKGTIKPISEAYSWYGELKNSFSKENVLQLIDIPDSFLEVEQQKAVILDETTRSVKKIKGFVEKYPETTFRFFYSPYSIAFWYNSYVCGTFLQDMENLEYSMKELLKCENLQLYFPSDYEMITDLESYKDLQHYDMDIQYQIFEKMKNEENMLTSENYQEYMNEFRDMVMECDFERVFSYDYE